MEAIGLNLPGLVAQIINFVLILVLLRMFLYKPILGLLDRRAERIRESLERAEAVQREADRSRAEFEEQIVEARRQGQQIVAQATEIGERLKEESRQEARREADAIITRANAEIQLEKDRALTEMRQAFADLTILAASRVIEQSLDKNRHQQLIDQVLTESTMFNGGTTRSDEGVGRGA